MKTVSVIIPTVASTEREYLLYKAIESIVLQQEV